VHSGFTGGAIVTLAVREIPLYEAVIVVVCEELTADAETANVPDVVPSATVTETGNDTDPEADDNDTVVPPEGAAAVSVTVPVTDPPLAIVEDDRLTLESCGSGGGAAIETTTPDCVVAPPTLSESGRSPTASPVGTVRLT
jgi:hypothetical protein